MKKVLTFLLILLSGLLSNAQTANCTFKPPFYKIHFGTGNVSDINTATALHYERVASSCPTDGHYAYVASTSDCFRGDWFDLAEDHTPGDQNGNMMMVNASYDTGPFLNTTIHGLKGGMTYQLGVWMMNLCRISDQCPYPLLPNITIKLQTPEGRNITQFSTGELQRLDAPKWRQYLGVFTLPASVTALNLIMTDNAPGGCGNDFALDDITLQECMQYTPAVITKVKAPAPKQKSPSKPVTEKKTESQKDPSNQTTIKKPTSTVPATAPVVSNPTVQDLPPPPLIIKTRANPLAKLIQTDPGEIRIDLYDNGQIDGDTITVYHNNQLVVAHAGLSAKPITFRISVDKSLPHHELIMVADNLGSIPPNTSLMIVTAGDKRYEVFISSSEQHNAKVIIDLKE